ncbi:hypothetical protein QC763_0059630 [Podospora pseudopauciseta]|uniref:Autophagy-related protein 27 n=1 Tax=Podospora pseudopauciseta TaxID=2093780 RepID=A0ABR0HIF2_9PEZI|nr:hypothetical protein QC763_0059630 [Podospora pseudopauciseta]
MARIHLLARLAVTASMSQIAAASFWTATEIFGLYPRPAPEDCDPRGTTGRWSCTGTTTIYLPVTHTTPLPGVTPDATTTTSHVGWDLEVVKYYYPVGAFPTTDLYTSPKQLDPERGRYNYDWFVDVTFTAPTSCPTPFEHTSKIDIEWSASVPRPLSAILSSKASIETEVVAYTRTVRDSTDRREETSHFTYTTLHVKATDLPPARRPEADMDRWRSTNDVYMRYLRDCYLPGMEDPRPTPKANAKDTCPHRIADRCSKIPEWAAVLIGGVAGLFVLGFVENFMCFRKLMQGRWCLRCGTVSWWLFAPLLMIFVTKYELNRNADEQEQLEKQWKEMPFWLKIKLWLQWGFRLKYPERWVGPKKPVGVGESIEMGISGANGGGGSGATGGTPPRAPAARQDDTPLPVYPGPPSSSVTDVHSMHSRTTSPIRGPVLGNPNAVLGSVLGSDSVVIGPAMSTGQQTPASPRRQDTDEGPAGGGIRAV